MDGSRTVASNGTQQISGEAFFRALVERSPDLLIVLGIDGIIDYVSPSAERWLGAGSAVRHPLNAFDFVHPEDAERARRALRVALTSPGAGTVGEYRVQSADGLWRCYEARCSPLPEVGRARVLVSAREVTRRAGPGDPKAGPESVLDRLNEIVFQTDPAGNWTYLNRAWTEILGFDIAESLGTNFLEYVHPDEREHTLALFAAVIAGGADHCHHETRYRRANGDYVWVELRARLQYDDAGEVIGNTGTLLDIGERRRTEALLTEQTHLLELVASAAPLHDTLAAIASFIARHLRATVAVRTQLPHAAPVVRRDDLGGALQAAQAGARATIPLVSLLAHPDGSVAPEWPPPPLHGTELPIRTAPEQARLGSIHVFRHDDTDLGLREQGILDRCSWLAAIAVSRRQAEQEASHRAVHDPLTGLPNRVLLAERLEQALAVARRRRHIVALLLIDLDRFKPINDTLGHEAGDLVLQHVAARLEAALPDSDLICRIGGDEFAIVLPELGGVEDARAVAAKVLRALEQPLELHDLVIHQRASAGIALYPAHDDKPAALLRRADVAMYRAKHKKTRVCVYDPRFDSFQLRIVGLAAELRRAIAADQLLLHYQPKLELGNGRVIGVEALVRWRHPSRGLMMPDQFIPLAERTGLAKALSLWVLRAALSESRLWRDRWEFRVAVNLPVQVLQDVDLPQTIDGLVDELQLDDAGLEFEITENEVMADPEQALQALRRLAAAGIAVTIDDFGTGYSSLTYLKRLPASLIKIDKSFIRDMAKDDRDASIVRSAIDLAHNLGMAVVAEGVETDETRALLASMDCDSAQGYQLAPPMPACELVGWLRRHEAAQLALR